MTRLSPNDIDTITDDLNLYDGKLRAATGCGLFELACDCFGIAPSQASKRAANFTIGVVPVTAGLGVISEFSNTVAGILEYLGFTVVVTSETDVTGIFRVANKKVDGLFLADDTTFMALDCASFTAIDNSEVTGRMYGTVLDAMAKDSGADGALVIGCGPVGIRGAMELLRRGRRVTLVDMDSTKAEYAAETVRQTLNNKSDAQNRVVVMTDLKQAVMCHDLILEATPAAEVLRDTWLTAKKKIAIPGVPPGVTEEGARLLANNLIHDKLELGVAGMAAGLLACSGIKNRS